MPKGLRADPAGFCCREEASRGRQDPGKVPRPHPRERTQLLLRVSRACGLRVGCSHLYVQVIVEKAERSDIPDIDKKK